MALLAAVAPCSRVMRRCSSRVADGQKATLRDPGMFLKGTSDIMLGSAPQSSVRLGAFALRQVPPGRGAVREQSAVCVLMDGRMPASSGFVAGRHLRLS
jgi:hypothetical protein